MLLTGKPLAAPDGQLRIRMGLRRPGGAQGNGHRSKTLSAEASLTPGSCCSVAVAKLPCHSPKLGRFECIVPGLQAL